MFYKVEFSVNNFEFWGGAKDRMDDATETQKKQVAERLEEYFSDGNIPTETEINDIVWFECDDIFNEGEGDEDEDGDE